MVKKLSCVSCGSLKRFPHTFTIISDINIQPHLIKHQKKCELIIIDQDFHNQISPVWRCFLVHRSPCESTPAQLYTVLCTAAGYKLACSTTSSRLCEVLLSRQYNSCKLYYQNNNKSFTTKNS